MFQVIANTVSFEFSLNATSPRFLAGNGSLSLGVSHYFVGGDVEYETGKNFLGDMSLFRMWKERIRFQKLDEYKCVDGDIVTWRTQDWDFKMCPPVLDTSLKCDSSKYKIQMNLSITQNSNNDYTEREFQRIVLNWLKFIFPKRISVHSVFLSQLSSQTGAALTKLKEKETQEKPIISRHWFDCVAFVRVIPADDVGKTVSLLHSLLIPSYSYSTSILLITNPASISILSVALLPSVSPEVSTAKPVMSQNANNTPYTGGTKVTVSGIRTSFQTLPKETSCSTISNLISVRDYGDAFYRVYVNVTINGTITDSKHTIERWIQETLGEFKMEVLNPVVQEGSKYITTFQVQALAPVNVTATATLIYELLSEGYANDTISITVPPCEINISQIDPGLCPEEPLFTVYGFYNWPSLTAQSTYEMGCVKGGQSATRFCKLIGVTDKALWDPPDMSKCLKTVSDFEDLENIPVTPENSEDIVDMIEDLLNGQTDLNDAQLDIVLEKLSLVTEVGTLTPDLSSSITHIVSDVCQITTNPPKVTNKILFITELMGDRTVFEGDAYNMTAPALALQLINPDTSPFHGLRFQVSSLRNDSTPEIYYDENFKEDPDTGNIAFISLPSTIENFFPSNGANPRVQFQFFAKENFFKDPSSNMSLNSYVVSASVTNASVSSLEMPVMVTLRHLQHKEDGSIAKCVFWDFSQNMNQGGWNETGCETVTSNATYTSCSCDHLTHFGVLLDISKTPISQKDERILTVISNLGCGISSIFLGVTLLTYLAFEKLRRDYPSKILINLSVALLGLNMLFLVNSWFASFNNRALCVTTAAFQHYFFLASFTWMGLGAINMYLALVKVFNSYVPSYILKFCAVGWGLPFLIVGLVLAIDVNSYGRGLYREVLQETAAFCWIQKEDVFYATVLAFAVLVLVCNFIVFSVVMVQIRRMHANKTSSARKGFLHDLRVVASLTFLLGLTWILVFFGWGPAKTPLMYMFSLLNSLQGFFIFLFYCLMKDNVRKQWRTHLCCGRFKLTEYSDWNSHSVAMGAKAKVGPKVSGQSMKSENTSERKISDTSNSGESTECGFLKDRTQ